jgi:photosystem II stability/assembly factor-like uncharacterized protein
VAGGRVASVVGVPGDPRVYYLGAGGGGVWKTENGGATWSPVFDQTGIASIGAIAIAPSDHRIVWVGTGEANPRNDVIAGAGIYESTDGGSHWTARGLNATRSIASIVVDPRDPNVVLVGALGDVFADSPDRGVFRTTDGGKTWTKTLFVGPASGVSEMVADPKNPDVIYAGIWQFRRQPWTFTSGGSDDGLYKSVDGGVSWTHLTGHGLPEGTTGRIGLAIAPSDPRRVYALIESKDGILWRSDDAGASWTLMTKNTLVDQRPFYFSHLRVDPSNPDHVYGVSEMLSESKDGGKTFKEIADDVHVDYHDLWIAPDDPKRLISGEDGGYAISLDNGAHWSFSANVPIGQIYHLGYDDETPYRVCVGLQDNNGFCGPTNALSAEGIPNAAWERVVGGDGQWAWPDPRDPNLVWTDLQTGRVSVYDRTAKRGMSVSPWIATSADGFQLFDAAYRFNWDTPIGFDPFDPATTWLGANVVFATHDRGMHWKPISPDLTANVKAHQQPAGGPLALDVSSAEYTDTILDVEGSTKTRGEIWVGTDDGLVQLTRDGGAHWRNVSPPGIPPYGRFEMVAPSPLVAGTAYAVLDQHYLGDPRPYAFVTHDWGAHWTSIVEGLPTDQETRAIRPDTRNPHLVYLGTERGLWLSYDDGQHWEHPALGLPPAPVFDLRVQPRWNDLLVATHGRDIWVFDDLAPVQELPAARAAGVALFPIRTAYAFALHADDEGLYTGFAGQSAPSGAVISFYQTTPGTSAPEIDVYDAHGQRVRRLTGTHRVGDRDVPWVTNFVGINRLTWDLREDAPTPWTGAARPAYQGPQTGPLVVPGTYTVQIVLQGRTLRRTVLVAPDPRWHETLAQYTTGHGFARAHAAEYGALDEALNRLDAIAASAPQRAAGASPSLAAELSSVRARALDLRGTLTADYENDEDSIQRPGRVREDLEGMQYVGGGILTPAVLEYARRVDAEYAAAMTPVRAFFANEVAKVDIELRAAGKAPLATSGAKRSDVLGTAADPADADADTVRESDHER